MMEAKKSAHATHRDKTIGAGRRFPIPAILKRRRFSLLVPYSPVPSWEFRQQLLSITDPE
jgi:hypothetical protein